jgi:hypothetical protein
MLATEALHSLATQHRLHEVCRALGEWEPLELQLPLRSVPDRLADREGARRLFRVDSKAYPGPPKHEKSKHKR